MEKPASRRPGVGAVLWWAFASWRLHHLHGDSSLTHGSGAAVAPVAKHVRGGKGGAKLGGGCG